MEDKIVTLEDLKAAQTLLIKPDWEQNDPAARDYIKNKPEIVPPTTDRIEMDISDTEVELEPNKFYVFPEMASLTITLATPLDDDIMNEYHFMFTSGSTATTLTIPASINHPDYFTVDSNMVYEISILENNMLANSWAVSS